MAEPTTFVQATSSPGRNYFSTANQGWTLAYTLINATAKITIHASASGVDFSISVPAAQTADSTSGSIGGDPASPTRRRSIRSARARLRSSPILQPPRPSISDHTPRALRVF